MALGGRKRCELYCKRGHFKPGNVDAKGRCKICSTLVVNNWHKNHPEKVAESAKRWRDKNKEKHKKMKDAWRKRNQPRITEQNRLRSMEVKSRGSFTTQEWNNLVNKYGHKCLDCGQKIKLTVDHILPISKGGMNTIDNIQPLCRPCNSKKGAKYLDLRYNVGSPKG